MTEKIYRYMTVHDTFSSPNGDPFRVDVHGVIEVQMPSSGEWVTTKSLGGPATLADLQGYIQATAGAYLRDVEVV